jgi:hypothetical protein
MNSIATHARQLKPIGEASTAFEQHIPYFDIDLMSQRAIFR